MCPSLSLRLRGGFWWRTRFLLAGSLAGMAVFLYLLPDCVAAVQYVQVERSLPERYIPDKTVAVTLRAEAYLSWLEGDVYEVLPAGWSFVSSDPAPTGFDAGTRRVHWHLEVFMLPGIAATATIRYEVRPSPGPAGDASFDGWFLYATEEGGSPVFATTCGRSTIQPGATRLVPQEYETIQGAIDASLPGDTVVVSPRGSPYMEPVVMKEWMDLVGAPGSAPPEVGSPGVAVRVAPHNRIRGLRISSGTTGIWAGYPVEVSDCLITGVQFAAIWFTCEEGEVTNCTIVGNGYGVYAGTDNPGVVVANCTFRDNGLQQPVDPFPNDFPDVSGARVLSSCLEFPVYEGSEHNNILIDPMFTSPQTGDYTLRPESPCIDAGDNSAVSSGERDLAGNARILFGGKGLRVDMGAYEYRAEAPGFQPLSGAFRLVWSSRPGKTYSVFISQDLFTWELAEDSVPSAGAMTLWLDPIGWPPTVPMRFYRIAEKQ